MKFYVVCDPDLPDPRDPAVLFRTPDRGGPPMELWDPTWDSWDEDATLIDYFNGDDYGAVEVPEDALDDIKAALTVRELADATYERADDDDEDDLLDLLEQAGDEPEGDDDDERANSGDDELIHE